MRKVVTLLPLQAALLTLLGPRIHAFTNLVFLHVNICESPFSCTQILPLVSLLVEENPPKWRRSRDITWQRRRHDYVHFVLRLIRQLGRRNDGRRSDIMQRPGRPFGLTVNTVWTVIGGQMLDHRGGSSGWLVSSNGIKLHFFRVRALSLMLYFRCFKVKEAAEA